MHKSIPGASGILSLMVLAASLFAGAPASPAAAPASRPANAPQLVPLTKDRDGNFRIAPPFTPAPEMTANPTAPKGKIIDFVMHSSDSKIYPRGNARGGTPAPFDRPAAVYIPAQYVPGTAAPFMVIQDGISQARARGVTVGGFYRADLPIIMDNLIAEKRLPVMLLVLLQPGPGDGPGSQRGLEYDTVSETYTLFIEKEVLPKIEKEQNVKFTSDPEGRGTAGGSSGAACALTMAWLHPELYRRVLSYSGTFVNQAQNDLAPRGAWEFHSALIPQSDPKPLHIWLEVGERDNGFNRDEASLHNWVLANQHMADVLKAKGYHYQFVFAETAGHVARPVLTATMPEAMQWLWKDYKPQ